MAAGFNDIDLTGARGCAAFNLRKTARVVTQAYDAALKPSGLRSTQFAILVAIARVEAPSVGALAETTLMDATTMTRNLKLLKDEGLIEVSPRGAGREKLVRLSKAGERALARAVPMWRAAQARFVEAFGSTKWSKMRAELEEVASLAADV
ncbi:MAG: MarR family winged helix-turn-helix transcriptional regulator [Micropepsaceae bacterium]